MRTLWSKGIWKAVRWYCVRTMGFSCLASTVFCTSVNSRETDSISSAGLPCKAGGMKTWVQGEHHALDLCEHPAHGLDLLGWLALQGRLGADFGWVQKWAPLFLDPCEESGRGTNPVRLDNLFARLGL